MPRLTKLEQIEQLQEWCYVQASIECHQCKKGFQLNNTDFPEEEAYKSGFRVFQNGDEETVLCPKCVKKNKTNA